MKPALVTKLCGLAAVLLAVGLVACSSDSGGDGGGGDAGDDRGRSDIGGNDNDSGSDTTSDVPLLDQGLTDTGGGDSGGDMGDICAEIGAATNVGNTCDPNTAGACGQGGACLAFTQGSSQCYQICVPSQCEDSCTGTERCLTIVDENGDPIPLFTGGPNAGVCSEPETGDQGAYDACGQTAGACQADFDCQSVIGLDGDPYCSPRCSADNTTCPSRESTDGQCVLGPSAGNPTNCALLCDEANAGTGTGCPAGMTCFATGQGAGICLWPTQ